MESDKSWEQEALMNELIQGLEVAKKLKEDLDLPSSVDTRDSLVQSILSSYDKALLILRWNASTFMSAQSPVSVETSPLRKDAESGRKDHQELQHKTKKRKMMPKLTKQVRVKNENGVEGPLKDGYSWRKYGQKDILSAKYPRSYYRCTFRKTKGCYATKQVQRSEEDPTIIDITYRGSHTCNCCKGNDVVLPQKSACIEEKPHGYYDSNNVQLLHAPPSSQSQESLTKYKNTFASLSTSFGCSMTQDNYPFLSSFSQTNLSSPSSFLVREFDGICNKPCPDSDAAGNVSPYTSTTNFPIFDFNFSIDEVGIDDSNFPFNASGFLS